MPFVEDAVHPAAARATVGDDAEYLASRMARVTAFDVSPTSIDWCRKRFPVEAPRRRCGAFETCLALKRPKVANA